MEVLQWFPETGSGFIRVVKKRWIISLVRQLSLLGSSEYTGFSMNRQDVPNRLRRGGKPMYINIFTGHGKDWDYPKASLSRFILVTMHSIFGNSKMDQRAEALLLDNVYSQI